MPIVPGQIQKMMGLPQEGPTPEQLLMTASDMQARGQLTEGPTSYKSLGASLKLPFPGGGRGPRHSGKGKR